MLSSPRPHASIAAAHLPQQPHAAALPIAAWLWGAPAAYVTYALLAAALIWYRHQENIHRLLAGTEPRIGQRVTLS